MTVIGVQPIALPRVVAQDDTRPELTDDQRHPSPGLEIAVQFSVDVLQESNFPRALPGESTGRLALLVLAARRKGRDVDVGVPGALGPVGAHQVVDGAAVGRPLGEQPTTSELDVVGMGADRQRRRRCRQVP